MIKRCLLFFFSGISIVVCAQQSAPVSSRVDTFLALINDTSLSSIDVRFKIHGKSYYIGKPLSADEYAVLRDAFEKRINAPGAGKDKFGFYKFKIDYYNRTRDIGKALLSADEYLKWAKSINDTAKLVEAYILFSDSYGRWRMHKEWLENQRKAFYLINKKEDFSKPKRIDAASYVWALTQVGWKLKDTVLMDSALFFLNNMVPYDLVNRPGNVEEIKNEANIYCLTLARLKRYPELIKFSRQIVEWNKNLPATQDSVALIKRQEASALFNGWIGKAYLRTNQEDSAFYYLTLPDHFFSVQITDYIQYPKSDKYIRWPDWIDIINCHVNFKQYTQAADLLAPIVFNKNSMANKEVHNSFYELSAPIFEKAGRKDDALTCYAQAKLISDSLQKLEQELFEEEKYTSTRLQIEAVKEAADLLNEKIKTEAREELEKQKMVRNGFIGGFAVVLLFASVFFTQRNQIRKGKKRSDELLLNILPEEVAEELKQKGHSDAQLIDHVTVLFTDFKGFTSLSEKVTPKELVADLHECFSAFDNICEKYGIEKIKTIGDAYMAAGGLPVPNATHAQDLVKAALEMREVVEKGKMKKVEQGLPYFEVRIGIHTGPVVAGIVGVKKFQYDIWGDTVNTASRMESSGEVGKVNISETTYELVKDQFNCEYRGEVEAKGKGKLKMFFVESV